MNPELDERVREFAWARHEIVDLVSEVDDDTFNRRPNPNGWSMAECVDHLVVVGRKMSPRLDAAILRARGKGWCAEGPFRYGRFEKWFANGMAEVPPRRRVRTPRLYMPQPRTDWKVPQAVEQFQALQDKFVQIVEDADGLDLSRIKVASPALGLLRLSLGQWLLGIAGHQKRHLWQAKQVKESVLDR